MKIGTQQLDDLTLGSVFLATGGGGDPHLPRQIAGLALEQYGPVDVLAVEDVPDEAYVVPVGGVGAPTVSLELLPSIDEATRALDAFEEFVGRSVDVVASFEIGGGNSLMPLVAAAGKGVPIIDGDGMGRALPEAQMMTYAIAGVKPTPAVALDYAGNTAVFSTQTTDVYEKHIRSFAAAAGGMITTAEHPMFGHQIKQAIIPGTLSFAIELGRVLREKRCAAPDMLEHLDALFNASIYGACKLLHQGKVIDKSTRIVGGYDVGEATIKSFDPQKDDLSITIKNEYLTAVRGEHVLATVPDLIVVTDFDSAAPINAEHLRYGQRVAVFAVGCPAFYRTERALKVVSPRNFGLDMDYVPLEDR